MKILAVFLGGLLLMGLMALGLYLSGLWDSMHGLLDVSTAASQYAQVKEDNVEAAQAIVRAKAAAKLEQELTGFGLKFKGLLEVMQDGEPHRLETRKLVGIKYWVLYYSASWCPPCRAFTPDLVAFYNRFKPDHPNFEVILVTNDQSESDMYAYMRNDAMPWPAVAFHEISREDLHLRQYCGNGIPCISLIDNDDNMLANNYTGGYHDLHDVIHAIENQVH